MTDILLISIVFSSLHIFVKHFHRFELNVENHTKYSKIDLNIFESLQKIMDLIENM